jgi:hypothetical protein
VSGLYKGAPDPLTPDERKEFQVLRRDGVLDEEILIERRAMFEKYK